MKPKKRQQESINLQTKKCKLKEIKRSQKKGRQAEVAKKFKIYLQKMEGEEKKKISASDGAGKQPSLINVLYHERSISPFLYNPEEYFNNYFVNAHFLVALEIL